MAKVLIVDDSAMSRRILKDILASDGHDVIEAQDGLTALETYFLQKPEVVMLDLIMKEMYGIEVLKKIRELDQNARVIVASADIQTSTQQLAQDAGAVAFISKPFVRDRVLGTIRSALERASDDSK
jgi:Response regulator containing CheY-like receiver, AAA-type ATPase, and DNA-binding domains